MSISHFQTEIAIQPGDERDVIAYLVSKKAKHSSPAVMRSVEELFSTERIRTQRSPNNTHSSEILLLRTDEKGTPNGIIVTPVMCNIGYDYNSEAFMNKNLIGFIHYNSGRMDITCMMPVSIFRTCVVKSIDEAIEINDSLRAFFKATTIDRRTLDQQPFTTILQASDFRKDVIDPTDHNRYTVVSSIPNGDVIIAPNISRWRANTLTSIFISRDSAFYTFLLPEILKNVIREE